MNVRPLGPDDVASLCALVDADRLPGQPACTPERVRATLAGRSSTDAWWWRQLVTMRQVAVESAAGELVGAGAVGRQASGSRHLLWLHAAEDRAVLEVLVWSLLRGARRGDPTFALWSSTELTVGLEGLPRAARPETHAALLARGFRGQDRWLYLRAVGPGPAPQTAPGAADAGGEVEFRRLGRGADLRVELTCGGRAMGDVELGLPAPGLGVLWWLEVEPEYRRRGRGRQLLRAARHALVEQGAKEIILFVDHDDPTARNRRPALELYLSEGFAVVDHLWSYRRGETALEQMPGRG